MNTRTKQCLAAAVLAVGLMSSKVGAVSTGFVDGTITVTPVVTVALSLSPTTYAFGNLDVNTSSVTATALVLNNNSATVNVDVSKQIPTDAGLWVADVSSAVANHYILSVATSSFRPNVNGSDFSATGTIHRFGAAMTNGGADTPLRGLSGGSQVNLAADGQAGETADLWFKLDMPVSVTNTTAQEIRIRFTGTAL